MRINDISSKCASGYLESQIIVAGKTTSTLQENLSSSNSTIAELRRSVHRLEKYSRRESIEIAVIARNIPHAILEDVVIKLLNKIDVNLTKNDLVVRHTLAISNRTIINVLTGKHVEQIMNNKSKLEGMNIEHRT